MGNDLRSACDGILQRTATGVPGVVAMITDRSANIYEGAAGKRSLGGSQPMTTDSVFAIYSTSKAITGTAALQCVEEGKLDLDAPAKNYVPDIGKLEVLDGFDADGNPKLRAPKRDITTRMLMLHTAGLGYDFFNANYLRLAQEHGQPSVITCSKASLMTPLLFDPGDKWEYGSNIDWCGQVVESIRGKRLGEVMAERIFAPLGIKDLAFSLTPSMRERLATIHQRELHSDTPSFALALRAALRQAPKVILVGEMRDRETIEIAMEAAETGHLVLSTLHTIDASKTVERILGAFPMDEQHTLRNRLAKSFRYIISQRLIPRKDGAGRIAAIEILKSTLRTRDYVEKGEGEGKTLLDAMRVGDQEGMQHFDGEIEKLIRAGIIDLETGLAYATNSSNLQLELADLASPQADSLLETSAT